MAAPAPTTAAPPTVPAAGAAAGGAAAGTQPQVFPSASLYVGDLSPDINEVTLYEIFNRVGTVASIRVCRDAMLRRSLGYAYVNYHNAADAERALDTLNFTPIKGKPCRVMWSHRDPSSRRNGKGNIFIKNLDKNVDNKSLFDTFSAFGNILSCKVATVMDGDNVKSLGHGFVHFETEEAANLAIEKVNGMLISDKKVFVGPFVPRSERSTGSRDHFTNVYIKNIPKDWTADNLQKEYSKYGTIQNAAIMTDGEGKSREFGFVNFEKSEDAKACVEASEKRKAEDPEGTFPYVARAQRKDERMADLRRAYEDRRREIASRTQGANLYVKNLDDTMDDDQLAKEFTSFGSITSAKVMVDDQSRSKGFGFVCFANPEDATRAIAEMNGKMMNSKPLYVALAQRRDQRRQMLEQQYPTGGAAAMQQQGMRGPMGPMGGPGMFQGGPGMYYQQGPGGRNLGGPMGYQQGMQRGGPGGMRYLGGPNAGPGQQGRFNQQGGMMLGPNFGGPQQQGFNPNGPNRGPRQNRNRQGPGGQPNGPMGQMGPGQQQGGKSGPQGGKPGGAYPPPYAGGKANVQFTEGARNMGAGGEGGAAPSKEQTLAQLASASPEEQRVMLGEQLYPLVLALVDQQLAGKVTGMLLEMETGEVLNLIESPDTELKAKVNEAVHVLQQAGQAPSGGAKPAAAPSAASEAEQKQALGEQLYHKISAINAELAPKITGMLLETGTDQVQACLADANLLKERVDEAISVLEAAQ